MNSAEFMGTVFAELNEKDLHMYARIPLLARSYREIWESPRGGAYYGGVGDVGNHLRLEMVAQYCARTWPGDLVEIGVLHGETTRVLAQVAQEHDRRMIAIDPFDDANPKYARPGYGSNYYQSFLDNTEPWRDIIDVVKLSSMDPEAIQYIEARPLCFAFVDGLHTYKACLSDIVAVGHCKGIIAVDDIHLRDQTCQTLLHAYWDGAIALRRLPMDNALSREGYLIPGDTR